MKLSTSLHRLFRRSHVPTLSLITLLQRTPVVPAATAVEAFVVTSPVGTVLKSLAAVGSSLGALNSLAGATPLVPTTGTGTGTNANVGTSVSISFTVTPTLTPIMSWKVGGQIPPGMNYSGLTAAGSVNLQNLMLGGTPTTAGTYAASLQAFSSPSDAGFASAVYTYTVTVTGSSGGGATMPAISTQPQSQTVTSGSNVMFAVSATGSPAPTYQWRKDGNDLAGETGASLSLTNVQTSAAGSYTVVVTNSAGSVTSQAAMLTVNAATGGGGGAGAPATPDKSGAYGSGATQVTLSWLAGSGGGAASTYRIERATDSGFTAGLATIDTTTAATSYVDATAAAGTTYFYRVSAVNSSGTSAPTASMQVTTPASDGGGHATFVNIATRAFCSTGDNVTIGGFVIGGSGPKRVLVRAVGPTLTTQGLGASEVLADPMLEVHHGSPVIASNDNWGDNANAADITSVAAKIGASPLASGDTQSAALLLTLNPGVYSFIVSGKGGSSGVVLLEVYDADAGAGAGTAPFVNIATRADATTGNGVTIGGFVITGSAPKQVLVRALGPTLVKEGLGASEVLADPVIELHHGSSMIAINDNWSDNANAGDIVTTGARIGATPIDSADTGSAAMLIRLEPGVYSFIASGKGNTTGVVLVEVYDAD